MWFTWCDVTLYDVRFATDSVFERVAHACHFGVMIGLAIIGPNFLQNNQWGPLHQLSLLLMASRVVLFCQYGTLFFTWRYRKTRLPLMIITASLFTAIIAYLGVFFVLYYHVSWNSYVTWFPIFAMETTVNTGVSVFWPALSLEKTHLVERMTCLTLIIVSNTPPQPERSSNNPGTAWGGYYPPDNSHG